MAEKVFHIVDGKMVAKPGNQRSPGRRYSAIATDPEIGESWVCEFTAEQEALRDAEEAKWEADRPLRVEQKKKQEAKFRAHRDSLKYETRLVAFLDILGWESATKKSLDDPELVRVMGLALDVPKAQAESVAWMQAHVGEGSWPGDPQMTHFSDSIVLSTNVDSTGQHQLVSTLSFLTTGLFWRGFLLRGGIACGPMYHKTATAYGPALISAYELQNIASYPRVILQAELAAAWGRGVSFTKPDGSLLGHFKTWRRDADGFCFHDYLQPFAATTWQAVSAATVQRTLERARKFIEEGLSKYRSQPRVHMKYGWLASYFNVVAAEYPAARIQPFDVP